MYTFLVPGRIPYATLVLRMKRAVASSGAVETIRIIRASASILLMFVTFRCANSTNAGNRPSTIVTTAF